jgi:peptidoglycan/xylan/chitin deacetylase (PgdA/CDA1 family)
LGAKWRNRLAAVGGAGGLALALASPGLAQPEARGIRRPARAPAGKRPVDKPRGTNPRFLFEEGAITRGDRAAKKLALVFTGDEFAEGAETVARVLRRRGVKASFFFTGRFYRNADFKSAIRRLRRDGHYLGAHSDGHLLYCDWERRDRLLVSREEFEDDLKKNYAAMRAFGISEDEARFFLPPYEWYNRSISEWTEGMGLRLISYTPGTRSNADYTTPGMRNYVGSEAILQSIKGYEARDAAGLNGFILLLHVGAGPGRADKFYNRLDELITWLRRGRYELVRIDRLLNGASN